MPIIKIFSPNINLPYFNRDRTQLESFFLPLPFCKTNPGSPELQLGPSPLPPLHPHFAKQTQVRSVPPPTGIFPSPTTPFCKTNPPWEPRAPARALPPSSPPPPFCKTNPIVTRPSFCKTNPLPTVYSLQPTPFFAKRTLPQKTDRPSTILANHRRPVSLPPYALIMHTRVYHLFSSSR